MALPEADKELVEFLSARGEAHYAGRISTEIRAHVAEMLIKDRKLAVEKGISPPGQAEYLDILRALTRFGAEQSDQEKALAAIGKFSLRKHPAEYYL